MPVVVRPLLASLLSLLAAASACAEGEETLYEVVKVDPSDVLYVRGAPEASAPIVGAIPFDASGITIVEQPANGSPWAKISRGDVQGYVNMTYLAPRTPTDAVLPSALQCGGTEPFWSFTRKGAHGTFEPMGEQQVEMSLREPTSGANRPNIWLLESGEMPSRITAFIRSDRSCSDGMSDTAYRYEIFLRANDRLLSGCCNPQ